MSIPTSEDASAVEGAMKRRERSFAPKQTTSLTSSEEVVKVKIHYSCDPVTARIEMY